MVSLTDTRSNQFLSSQDHSSLTTTQKLQQKPAPKSMRTVRSKLFSSFVTGNSTRITEGDFSSVYLSESSGIIEALANASPKSDFLDLSQAFSDFSAYSSDISGELQRLANLPGSELNDEDIRFGNSSDLEAELGLGFLKPETSSLTEIVENLDPEKLERAVKTCVSGLGSGSIAVKRCAVVKMAEQLHPEQAIPRSHQLIKAATAVILGGALMVLSGLTLAGTVIGLTIATPLMVIFSPVLVPAVISIVLVMTGFLFSGGCGMASISVFSWMYKFLTGKSPPGADKLEQAHRQIASKARDMKERAEQYGHAQGRAHEGTQGS